MRTCAARLSIVLSIASALALASCGAPPAARVVAVDARGIETTTLTTALASASTGASSSAAASVIADAAASVTTEAATPATFVVTSDAASPVPAVPSAPDASAARPANYASGATQAPTSTSTSPPTTVTTVPETEPPPPTTPPPPAVPPLTVVLAPMTRGAQGDDVKLLQQRLLDLGFWLDSADGVYGAVTAQAVMAFQKYTAGSYNLDPSGNADRATVDALATMATRPQGLASAGDLIEIDKARQVLFIVRGGQVAWVLNASTGSSKLYTETNQKLGGTVSGNAVTPEGEFKVYREYAKGWETGELGELYRPKYIKGGVAIHGHGNVPNYPASHGCVRVSLAAMDWIWANDILAIGQPVWVHGAP